MLLTTTWFGTFLIDPTAGTIVKKQLFPKTVSKLVERLQAIQNGEILTEEQMLVKNFQEPFSVTESRLMGVCDTVEGVTQLPDSISLVPTDFGFDSELYHEVILELGKQRTRMAVTDDNYIIQAIKCLDDLTQIANLLSERLHEWYGLHWPELEKVVKETEYINLISEFGDRQTITNQSKNEKLKQLVPSDSLGTDLGLEDKGAIMGYAVELKNVYNTRIKLEQYIKTRMESLAPNVTSLTGAIIGARLIALTGGLSRLSRVSSSTIQLLGAEKALFRHLRDGELPPKHGIIFQHPLLHNAPYWQRGKIARALAGKIAIAAKLDYNSDKLMGEELLNEVKKRIEEIRKKYPEAPVKRKIEKRSKKGKNIRRGGHGRTGKKSKKRKRE